jgi:hypothetical protein
MISNICLDDERQLYVTVAQWQKADKPLRQESFRKPGRGECAEWETRLNRAMLATDIRKGWEGFVELFGRFYDEEVTVIEQFVENYRGAFVYRSL